MWTVLRETVVKWYADNPGQRGAALAFYALFAIAPLLIIAVAISGSVFGIHATENQIVSALRDIVGVEVAAALQATIRSASRSPAGGLSAVIGLVTLLLGAIGVLGELQNTLNAIWHVQPEPGRQLLSWVRGQLITLLMVLGVGFFLLLSLIISMGTVTLTQVITARAPRTASFLQWTDIFVSFVMVTLMFAATYKVVPAVHIAWRDVWVGAVVTSALFTFGKWLIGWYLIYSSIGSAYGAAGSIIVILLWVYYCAQVCLFGAEFTWVHAHHYGSGISPKKGAVVTPHQ
ncbi:MAG: YihY/virulence factor BrkB family protein [Deltaproteobacteria bacterium]|nr:YihY/virulence factor BrkB family protein [Deltaproteobacteria bacterium]